jgi:hypothetical protein|tara:strand:+ start:1002 stop:1991 length:990 start_codon:yes stop_codon:yes gene_type:complete
MVRYNLSDMEIYKFFFIFLTLSIIPGVEAQNCGSIATDIRGVQTDAFDEYPALMDLKQGLLLLLYGRGNKSCSNELYEYSINGREYLLKFHEAYVLSKSGSIEDRITALNLSKSLKESIGDTLLGENLGVSALDISNSANIATNDFLISQGTTNEQTGEFSNITREKIEYYQIASVAYEISDDMILSANTQIIWKQLENKYLSDIQKATDLEDKAYKKIENNQNFSRNPLSLISSYINSKESGHFFDQALLIYNYHGESIKISEIESNIKKNSSVMFSLLLYIVLIFVVFAIFSISLALFLLNRILMWEEDNYEYYLGNELIRVKVIGR